jgi:hypothetical protein
MSTERDNRGRFLPGNKAGRGNPTNRKAQQLREALLRSVSVSDLRAIVKRLVEQAKAGDVAAAKIVFDRTLGPPVAIDLLERLEQLEQLTAEQEQINGVRGQIDASQTTRGRW